MRRGKVSLEQFFERLYEIFLPNIGERNTEPGVCPTESAFQASFSRGTLLRDPE
jgi:hypothetical protein